MDRAVTITEAAHRLRMNRHEIWQLVKEGMLPCSENPLGRREKLIPMNAIERLAATGKQPPRALPRSIGIVADGSLPSRDSEVNLRETFQKV